MRSAQSQNKQSTILIKRSRFRKHVLPAFGAMRLDNIGLREIEEYKAAKLANGVSAATINLHLANLSTVLTTAVEWKLMTSPPPRIKRLKEQPPPPRFLDFDEAQRLLSVESTLHAQIALALHTGMRVGELCALAWESVDFDRRTVLVKHTVFRPPRQAPILTSPKGGRERKIPMSDVAYATLWAHRHDRGRFVFPGSKSELMVPNPTYQILHAACDEAGIDHIGWHVLRHTFASHLVMRGIPLRIVQELLGHASIEMTMNYFPAQINGTSNSFAFRQLARFPL